MTRKTKRSFSLTPKGLVHISDIKLRNLLSEKGAVVEELYSENDPKAIQDAQDRKAIYSPVALILDAKEYGYYDAPVDEEEEGSDLLVDYLAFLHELHATLVNQAHENCRQGAVTTDDLFLLLQKGVLARVVVRGAVAIVKLDTIESVETMFGSILMANVGTTAHSGKGFVRGKASIRIPTFEGKKNLSDLRIRPLTPEDDLSEYKERGLRVATMLQNPYHGSYSGNLLRQGWTSDSSYEATGRVMVDISGMQQSDESYDFFWGANRVPDTATLGFEELQEIDFICMTPFVYGFSFRTKVWGEMIAANISPVQFCTESFQQLVLDPEIKTLVRTLVASKSKGKDFIEGKGGGCIFLLDGEPGTGKTLTAEAVSEDLKRPLHSVSVGELGTNPDDLDKRLRMILEVAARWNAVLLLDECDVFLEARSDQDIQRNAMVSVFLRLLEYYPGILFLTTNRSSHLDAAVYSRVSLPIHYPRLPEASLRQVWQNHLQLNEVEHQDYDLDRLAREANEHKLNGRQIKNCVRQACALADYENRPPKIADVVYLLKTLKKFASRTS